jgi:hypothetical protein
MMMIGKLKGTLSVAAVEPRTAQTSACISESVVDVSTALRTFMVGVAHRCSEID